MSTISISSRGSSNIRLTVILLYCGIISSILYAFMNVYVAMQWKEYSSVSQTVSELSAIGAPTRSIWLWLASVYTVLIISFGIGVKQSAYGNRVVNNVGNLILLYGLVSLAWPFAPMHLRGDDRTFTDTMHISLAVITVVIMVLAIIYGSKSFGRKFNIYSWVTLVILLVFGILTAIESPDIPKDLPTPLMGIWERVNIGAFLMWIVVLSILLLRREKV